MIAAFGKNLGDSRDLPDQLSMKEPNLLIASS